MPINIGVKISALPSASSVTNDDLMIVVDHLSGTTKQLHVDTLIGALSGGLIEHDHSTDALGGTIVNPTVLLLNDESVATTNDLDLEIMRMNFQYVSWAQFAIYDSFVDSTKRLPGDTGTAVIQYGELIHGNTVPNSYSVFNSKIYNNITTLFTGSGIGGTNSFTASGQNWFTDEVKLLTLKDSTLTSFTILSNSGSNISVSGSTASGPYTIYTDLPANCVGFLTYKDSTNGTGSKYNGFIKYEFSTNGGTSYVTILNTETSYDRLSATINFNTIGHSPGRNYCARLTLKNDSNGSGSSVQNFLIATDPSIWRF